MRFSLLQATFLPILGYYSGLVKAQDCGTTLVDFEDFSNVPAPGTALGASLIPNGYHNLNWANLYAVAPSDAAQFLLPQGDVFASTVPQANVNTATISAITGSSFHPIHIFLGTYSTNGVSGAASLPTASVITVTATFSNGTTAETTFSFNPPGTVLGLGINAAALQIFSFPCGWVNVVSLAFAPRSESLINTGLGLAVDDFEFTR